jgi:DNA polymerase epsilon subunit 2
LKTFGNGMITEGCFVLCFGSIQGNKVFHVETMELPPIMTKQINDPMKEEEEEEEGIVFLSDVHLNNSSILNKIAKLFDGYKDDPPLMFVFMGEFINVKFDISMKSSYISNWMALASLIRQYPSIHKNTKFLFIPGPKDPGFNSVLPMLPISNYFIKNFIEKVPKAEFASNPCKIQFKSKEFIIFRSDMLYKMRKNCIVDPNESMNSKEHVRGISI